MKLISKIFTIGISAFTAVPLITSCVPTNNAVASTNSADTLYSPVTVNEETKHYACTVTYIGKDCTADGRAIACRATDSGPKAQHLKLKHYAADEIANKTLVGGLGMQYTMPAHTLAYTSCPLSEKGMPDPTWGTGLWENNGINEMGVGVSATLTTYSNPKIALRFDEEGKSIEKFIKDGVGEELLPIIMAAQATSARNAMEVAAAAIDKHGAQDANIIFATDQKETWLMEIYSLHQYCAVKLPDDKCFVAGNEFILDSLHDLGINESNKDEMCITSANLLKLPVDNGLAKFKYDATETEKPQDIYHLDLFNTYAREGTSSTGTELNNFDQGCHMRTWRGYSLFDRTVGLVGGTDQYQPNKKYAPFLTPRDENGVIRKDMSARDAMNVYRDEYDELVDENSKRYDSYFKSMKDAGNWRTIAVQQTRAIHIMFSDPNKPKWIAANEWYTPDSGNYAPFLLINNAMTSIDGEFGTFPDRFEYTQDCAAVLYRELNKLAWYDRTNYGMPLQKFWTAFEDLYGAQMQQVIDDASQLSKVADAKNIVTNFNKHVRDIYVKQIKKTTKDLMWHIMHLPQEGKDKFVPLIDLEQYVTDLGWTNYKFDGSKVTFEIGSTKATYEISDGTIYHKGTLTLSDSTPVELADSVVDGKVYVDMLTLNNEISHVSGIKHININDYLDKINNAVWIVPLVITVALAAGIVTYVLIKKRKNKKAKAIATPPTAQ